jgi:hypothetical protein
MATDTSWQRRMPRLFRWLHIYLSMISFAVVFFFAITGLTLNHADRFGDEVRTKEDKGQIDSNWVRPKDTAKIARLQIVEYFRSTYRITAAVSEFRIDDEQCTVSFKGPGYAADVFINRQSGTFDLTQTSAGFVGLINDLHKGRDTGHGWSVFIDLSALFLTLVSLTGITLMLYMKKKRLSGLIVAAVGSLLAYLVYVIWIK